MDAPTPRPLPRYKCHKEVNALKIKEVKLEEGGMGGATIIPDDSNYASFHVDHMYVMKHSPQAGGYYVRYDDGYESWSPAPAFEAGYTLVNKGS